MPSLKQKIGRIMGIYAVMIIALIFIFQAVLLQPMYTRNKIRTVQNVSEQVEAAVGTDAFFESVYRLSRENDACVRIIAEEYEMADGVGGCILYRMNYRDLQKQAVLAEENGGTYLSVEEEAPMGGDLQNVIYTRIMDDGTMILVSTNLTALNATVRTLRIQMLYISVILLCATGFLVWFINRKIGDPLVKINAEAAHLAEGKYQTAPGTDGYQEAVELNRTLSQAARDINKADQAKRDLIANVSHDLRTPLTMIGGYGEMMRDIPGEKTDENLQVIIDESQRLNRLVNDLLDLSRMQENRITLSRSVFDPAETIRHEMKKYEIHEWKDGFQFTVECEEGLLVHADEPRIAQVLNNFLSNAVNYSTDDKRICVRCFAENDSVVIEVEDHGEGIPSERLEDVWDRYYKVDRRHVRPVSGSGLGLSIVRGILELHGAKYGVRSKEGEGSTFWFALPRYRKDENTGNGV